MTVADALADFEGRLDHVERALDAGDDVELPAFQRQQIDDTATPADLERLKRALARLQDCQQRMHAQRTAMLEELADLDTRRDAAAAYLRND